MKCVMLSIRPKYCELIASGKKTVEVRKTKPKIDVPFKCYIYCTKGEHLWKTKGRVFLDGAYNRVIDDLPDDLLDGKVIGEFVCDKVDGFTYFENCVIPQMVNVGIEGCLTLDELAKYFKVNSDGYAWHISDLVIYDKPKELSEFYQEGKNGEKFYYDYCAGCPHHETPVGEDPCNGCDGNRNYFYRPPQSWCYCEELLPPLVEPKCKTITIPRWTYNEHKGETE